MEPKRHIGFSITPIEAPHESDPARMTVQQLRQFEHARGPGAVAREVRNALARIPLANTETWPDVLRQNDFVSCQTIAVVNGIRACQAPSGNIWQPSLATIQQIRREAGLMFDGGGATMAASSTVDYLQRQNIIRKRYMGDNNPIAHATRMFSEGGFAVVTEGQAFHATTVVPNFARIPDSNDNVSEFIRIDSLSGRQTALGAEGFSNLLMSLDWAQGDEVIVCVI